MKNRRIIIHNRPICARLLCAFAKSASGSSPRDTRSRLCRRRIEHGGRAQCPSFRHQWRRKLGIWCIFALRLTPATSTPLSALQRWILTPPNQIRPLAWRRFYLTPPAQTTRLLAATALEFNVSWPSQQAVGSFALRYARIQVAHRLQHGRRRFALTPTWMAPKHCRW